MDWNQSKLGYYADLIVVPIIVLLALIVDVSYHGPRVSYGWSVPLGFGLWTLAEYWIHRTLFHHFFRREHWFHHMRPQAYDAVPWWMSAIIQVLLYGGLVGSIGMEVGTGLFIGFEAGYITYFLTHDAIHHGRGHDGLLRRKWRDHMHHHSGKEVNFGVTTGFWDRVFGTYWR